MAITLMIDDDGVITINSKADVHSGEYCNFRQALLEHEGHQLVFSDGALLCQSHGSNSIPIYELPLLLR